jgi:hypothetical protein
VVTAWVLFVVALVSTAQWLHHAPESSRSGDVAGVLFIVLALVGPIALVVS